MSNVIAINASISWAWAQDGDMWIADCAALGQVVQAESFTELIRTIEEVQDSLIRILYEDGDLERFLRTRGWQPMSVPKQQVDESTRFEIPFELTRGGYGGAPSATA